MNWATLRDFLLGYITAFLCHSPLILKSQLRGDDAATNLVILTCIATVANALWFFVLLFELATTSCCGGPPNPVSPSTTVYTPINEYQRVAHCYRGFAAVGLLLLQIAVWFILVYAWIYGVVTAFLWQVLAVFWYLIRFHWEDVIFNNFAQVWEFDQLP